MASREGMEDGAEGRWSSWLESQPSAFRGVCGEVGGAAGCAFCACFSQASRVLWSTGHAAAGSFSDDIVTVKSQHYSVEEYQSRANAIKTRPVSNAIADFRPNGRRPENQRTGPEIPPSRLAFPAS